MGRCMQPVFFPLWVGTHTQQQLSSLCRCLHMEHTSACMHPVATGCPSCLPSSPSITTRRLFTAYTGLCVFLTHCLHRLVRFPYSLDCRVRSVTAVAQQAVLSVKLLCPSAHTLATTQPLSPAASTSTFKTHRATLGGCLHDAFMQPM
jgi:hypothetical protein